MSVKTKEVSVPSSREEIIKQFRINEKDTGSASVQVALLTSKILGLSEHMKVHKKDNHTRRGLVAAVSNRKKLLSYLKKSDESQYQSLIAALGLRK